jgi:hypothetical protein
MVFCLGAQFCSAVARPEKVCGIYLSIWTMHYPERCRRLIKEAKEYKLNTLVCDFNGVNKIYLDNFRCAQQEGFYKVARIVVFEEGIGADYASSQDTANWHKKLELAAEAERIGFEEIQFDYIRFADAGSGDIRKKEIVEKFLREAKARVKIPVGADVFGSVAYQPHHLIGQDLNRMAEIIDVVSPMLYPSHFLKDSRRLGRPYETILEGSTLAKRKIGSRPVRMVPFIQGFAMNMEYSGLSLKDYIKAQLNAVEDAGADGFYVWHAANDYRSTWQAIREHGQLFAKSPKSFTEIKQVVSASIGNTAPDNQSLLADLTLESTEQSPAVPVAGKKNTEQNKNFDLLSFLSLGML